MSKAIFLPWVLLAGGGGVLRVIYDVRRVKREGRSPTVLDCATGVAAIMVMVAGVVYIVAVI